MLPARFSFTTQPSSDQYPACPPICLSVSLTRLNAHAHTQADARFKLVWYEAGLIDALLGIVGATTTTSSSSSNSSSKKEEHHRPCIAPFTVSLALDTLLWLVRGCPRNARLVVASGGARALASLFARDTHFPEGIALWSAVARELAAEMTAPSHSSSSSSSNEEDPSGVGREFADVDSVAVADLEARFDRSVVATGAAGSGGDAALGGAFHNGGIIAVAYVRGAVSRSGWCVCMFVEARRIT